MKSFIYSLLFIFTALSFSQQLDDRSLAIRFDPVLGTTVGGGILASYPLPWPMLSIHAGYNYRNRNIFSDDPTGWVDLGLSVHTSQVKRGINLGAQVLYSLGLRDGFGYKIIVTPMGQLKTDDDNLLTASFHVSAGSVDLQISPTLDWQWCWDNLFLGPRFGYAITQSNPILGGTLGLRW